MHLEALPEKNRPIFTQLQHFTGFYLAGGTALALQIGHRISVDFDLFIPKPLSKKLLAETEKTFKSNKVQTLVNNQDELTILVNGIKITFLQYPFPILRKLVKYEGLLLLDVVELAVTKAYTIGRRGNFKDYVDLYFILKSQLTSLNELTSLAEKKFKKTFNARLFLEQLVYLEDISDTKIQFLKETVNKKQLQDFFLEQIKQYKLA